MVVGATDLCGYPHALPLDYDSGVGFAIAPEGTVGQWEPSIFPGTIHTRDNAVVAGVYISFFLFLYVCKRGNLCLIHIGYPLFLFLLCLWDTDAVSCAGQLTT